MNLALIKLGKIKTNRDKIFMIVNNSEKNIVSTFNTN